jgi:DegV family protein with EDD domain
MKNTVILTDSASSVPQKFIDTLPIRVLPLSMVWDNKILIDGEDITAEEFYPRLAASNSIPQTSQLTTQMLKTVFDEEIAKGNSVLCLFLSSGISGTYATAVNASKDYDPNDVVVLDSTYTCMGTGWLVVNAARLSADGGSLQDCINLVNDQIKRTKIYFNVDTLEYLHKGGRISHAKNMLGSLLNLKPILTMENTLLEPYENIRTSKKAQKRVVELVKEFCEGKKIKHLTIQHADALSVAEEMLAELKPAIHPEEYNIDYLTPVVGVHTGPGCIAFFIVHE